MAWSAITIGMVIANPRLAHLPAWGPADQSSLHPIFGCLLLNSYYMLERINMDSQGHFEWLLFQASKKQKHKIDPNQEPEDSPEQEIHTGSRAPPAVWNWNPRQPLLQGQLRLAEVNPIIAYPFGFSFTGDEDSLYPQCVICRKCL